VARLYIRGRAHARMESGDEDDFGLLHRVCLRFHIETPERQFICPKCKRLIVFEWGVAGFDHEQPEACDEEPESETVA
jgi:hypothetical protein